MISQSRLPAFTVLRRDDDVLFARWRNVFLIEWHGVTTAEHFRDIERYCLRLIKEYPQGIFTVTLATAGTQFPPKQVMEVCKATIARLEPNTIYAAFVMEGAGIWTSLGLAVARAAYILSGVKRSFLGTDLDKALAHCADRSGTVDPSIRAENLSLLIQQVRADKGATLSSFKAMSKAANGQL